MASRTFSMYFHMFKNLNEELKFRENVLKAEHCCVVWEEKTESGWRWLARNSRQFVISWQLSSFSRDFFFSRETFENSFEYFSDVSSSRSSKLLTMNKPWPQSQEILFAHRNKSISCSQNRFYSRAGFLHLHIGPFGNVIGSAIVSQLADIGINCERWIDSSFCWRCWVIETQSSSWPRLECFCCINQQIKASSGLIENWSCNRHRFIMQIMASWTRFSLSDTPLFVTIHFHKHNSTFQIYFAVHLQPPLLLLLLLLHSRDVNLLANILRLVKSSLGILLPMKVWRRRKCIWDSYS